MHCARQPSTQQHFDLSVCACASQTRPLLSDRSRLLGAPTSCEVLFYPAALNQVTGRHRDAFTSADLHEYYRTGKNPFAEDQWGQAKGTDVLIFTIGTAEMVMGLSFPVDKLSALDRATYIQPSALNILLRPGTLLVFRALDDLFFCHEVRFPTSTTTTPAPEGLLLCADYRAAIVFRWLNVSEERQFYLDTGRQVLSREEIKKWKKAKKPRPR